jgi:gamma-glutamylcyclotransferase (GGCT)/AIG2-like uncharacterized protein YtfP
MLFFFYGTLLDGSDNPVARDVHRLLERVGNATAGGNLVAIPDAQGWFPGLIAGEGLVRGTLYRTRGDFTQADLARLDAYEDVIADDPARSLYRRVSLDVCLGDGSPHIAQAYLFNQPIPPGSLPIPGGSFRNWLAERGETAFSGLRDAD